MKSVLLVTFFLIKLVIAQYTPTDGLFNAIEFENWVYDQLKNNQKYLKVTPGNYLVPTNSTGVQSFNIYLSGIENCELDMDGVYLIFEDRGKAGVLCNNCTGVYWHGADINWQYHGPTQCTIDSFSDTGKEVNVTFHQGYSLDDWVNAAKGVGTIPVGYVFDPNTTWWKEDCFDQTPTKVYQLSSSQFTLVFPGDIGPSAQNVQVGDYMAFRSAVGSTGFMLQGCGNMTIEDITLHTSGGFGYFESMGYGNNTWNHISIVRGPLQNGATVIPLLSTSADGLHSNNMRHGPVISNVYFEGMPDDGIAIHGKYSLIMSASGTQIIVTEISTAYMPGDVLRLYDDTFSPQGNFTLLDIKPLPNSYVPPYNKSHTQPYFNLSATTYLTLTLDRPVPASFDWLISDSNTEGMGYVLYNNTIYRHRARGMLLKSSNGHVINNVIDGSSMGGMAIFPELYWNEADYSHNLLVCGNTIRNVAYHKYAIGGVLLTAVNPKNSDVVGYGHVNVDIVGNLIENVNMTNLVLTSGTNIVFHNNQISNPLQQAPYASSPIYNNYAVAWVSNIQIDFAGNCISNIGKFAYNLTEFEIGVNSNVASDAVFKECINPIKDCTELLHYDVSKRLKF